MNLSAIFTGLLPQEVSWVVATPPMRLAPLFASEAAAVSGAVPERVAEFKAGRATAREALAAFGVAPLPLPARSRRTPSWPAGYTGSITHCPGLCAAAVARTSDLLALGIDAEPADPLPADLLRVVTVPAERLRLESSLSGRLLFSAKEAFYKCWSQADGRFLDFAEVEINFAGYTFYASPVEGGTFLGHWAVRNGFVLTSCWILA